METYRYQNAAGKVIYRKFAPFCAPPAIGEFRIIPDIKSFPVVRFKGKGWATRNPDEHRVSWYDVEKHLKHNKITAKENQEKKFKRLKSVFADSI